MEAIKLPWPDLKTLIISKSISYDVIDRAGRKDIVASPGSGVLLESHIVNGSPDETDFNTNFASGVSLFGGGKVTIKGYRVLEQDYYRKSFKYTALAGQTTEFNEKFTEDVYFQGGDYKIGSGADASGDDYLEFEVVDIDNLLGYGAGFVLKSFIDQEYVEPGDEEKMSSDDAALVPAGIYLRVRYVSVGATNVKLRVRYKLRR